MSTEVTNTGEGQEISPYEQEMMDLVDKKEADALGQADPSQAKEYIEETPKAPEEIDYKAEYEKLLEARKQEEGGLDIKDTPEEAPEPPADNSLTPEQMTKYTNEFNSKGALGPESYAELSKIGLSKSVVDAYIAGQVAVQEAQHNKAYSAVGGEDNYKEMIAWAKATWTPEQISVFNSQVQSGNESQIMFGVESLKAQYTTAQGSPIPSRRLSGTSQGTSSSKGYASKAEMYAAMRNPSYGKDASYTQSVAQKIALSDF